jgi:hypothetical protein
VLIIQRRDDRITRPCHGRYLAAHLPDARYFEQPGDHLLWLGDTDAMFTQIQGFLAAAAGTSAVLAGPGVAAGAGVAEGAGGEQQDHREEPDP